MTIKDKEKVLKYIYTTCTKTGKTEIYDMEQLYDEFQTYPFFSQIIKELEDDGLITVCWADDGAYLLSITPAGLIYFDEKRQSKIDYWKNFAVSHIATIIVSAIVALITALLTA